MLRGTTDLPLHYGQSPRWLFDRMKKLASAITKIIIDEYGKEEFLKRLSEPYWFQSFACVLGFDWHSSGTTTVTMGALKEALRESELNQEIVVIGGKGKTFKKVPGEIEEYGEKFNIRDKKIFELIKISKLVAKVDNTAIQDGFNLYHHTLVFTNKAKWAIIQQGMSNETSYARRYHWLSNKLNKFGDFVNEPHEGVVSDIIVKPLNMVASEAEEARKTSLDLIKDNPVHLRKDLISLKKFNKLKFQTTISSFSMSQEHFPKRKNLDLNFKLNFKTLKKAYEQQPKSYEEILMIKGIGPKTIRSLALISNLIYGSELSWRDPCKYAFAHGGKDGWPYPVNKKRYDKSIKVLKEAIEGSKLERKEKLDALKRLRNYI